MPADKDDALIGIQFLDGAARWARSDHLLGGSRRLMPEHDHTDETGIARNHLVSHEVRSLPFSLGVNNLHRITAVPHIARNEPAP